MKHQPQLNLLVLILALPWVASSGQATSGGSSAASPKAQQVPLSGRSQSGGSVQSQQTSTTNGGSTSSVDTINSSIQVSGSYQGSTAGPAVNGVLKLTVADAIQRGLLYNLGTVGASASVRQARGQRLAALSQMLPNIYGSVAENGAKADLQAEGLTPSLFSGGKSGASSISLPTTVGPYHYYSAQANAEESLSFTNLNNLRTANASLKAAELNAIEARELVVLAVGGAYLRLLASKANVMAEEGEAKQAGESFKQTAAQFDAGLKTVIDNNKSLIQFRTEQQRLSSLRSDLKTQTMQLARMIGLPSGQLIEFQEDLPAEVPDTLTLDEAIQQAQTQRADLKAARQQLQAATSARRAAKSEYLPSVSINGDYGLQGINPNKGVSVFQASATLSIPIFSSGRNHADVEQADAVLSQRQAEYEDQRGLVELDVREAYENLQVARQQLDVSRQNRDLAAETLTQSLDRFEAGVTDSVEVVQSQETVDSANRDYVSSLFSLNLARISLAKATGQAEKFIPNMLVKGN